MSTNSDEISNPTVKTCFLVTASGIPIRKSTKVVFMDGKSVCFTERMGKKEAIKQARELIARRKEK